MNRFEELTEKYLEKIITQEEAETLAEMVHRDPDLCQRFIELARLDGMLYARSVSESNKDAMAERVQQCLRSDISRKAAGQNVLKRIRNIQEIRNRRARFPRIIWISLAACLMVMAGAYFYNIYQMKQIPELIKARIIERQGKVKIRRKGNEKIIDLIDDRDMEIHAGDVIHTGPHARAVIKYTDEDTRIRMSEITEVRFEKKDGYKYISLESGRVECEVERSGFRAATPFGQAVVEGTRFSLETDSSVSTLRVVSGTVSFMRLDNRKTEGVKAGDEAVIQKDGRDIELRPISEPYSLVWDFENNRELVSRMRILRGPVKWMPPERVIVKKGQFKQQLAGMFMPGQHDASFSEFAKIALPFSFPSRPVKVRIVFQFNMLNVPAGDDPSLLSAALRLFWGDLATGKMLPRRELINKSNSRMKHAWERNVMEFYLYDQYIVELNNGTFYVLTEFKKPYPSRHLLLYGANARILKIEAESIDADKIPEKVRNAQELKRTMEQSGTGR